jgi:hypothetical protein
MAIMEKRAHSRRWLRGARSAPLLFGAFFACSPARAQFEFTPQIAVGVARTDNLTLDADNQESETVYQLVPEFHLTQQSQRFASSAAYRIDAYRYAERSDSDVHHVIDGQLRTILDIDNFFIDIGGSRQQSIRDPTAPIPRSNLPISSNLVDRDEFYAGPTFQYGVGANLAIEGSFRRSWIRYNDDAILFGDTHTADQLTFTLNNYGKQSGFTWAATYDSQKVDYDELIPYEFRRASIELGAWLKPGLRVFASGGKESDWENPFDPSLADGFNAEIAVGERTFGKSGRALIGVGGQRVSASLRYIQRPTTEGLNPYNRGGLMLPDTPEDFLAHPGNTERYVSKRLEWSLGVRPRRSTLTLTVFDENREQRTRIDGTPLPDEGQSGGYLTASMQLGSKTDLVLSLQRVNREFSATEVSTLTATVVTLRRRPSPRTTLELNYSVAREEFTTSYDAHMISFLMTRSF